MKEALQARQVSGLAVSEQWAAQLRQGAPRTHLPPTRPCGGSRRRRRLAHSYLAFASNGCSAVCGYGLALLLGFSPPAPMLELFNLIRTHLGPALGAVGLLVGLAVVAHVRTRGEQRERVTAGKRLRRVAGKVLRSAAGSVLASAALRLLVGLDLLPLASPLARLASWLAARLALSGAYRMLLLTQQVMVGVLHRTGA